MKANRQDIKKQRKAAAALVYKLTGKKLKHLKTGRPFADKSIDISISHKDDIVAVASVPAPYRIGIDVENLKTRLNAGNFLGTVITKSEIRLLKQFCKRRRLARSSGIAVFWSIKESFFKCLDYNLKPGKISVLGIAKNGNARLGLTDEIGAIMKKRKLGLCLVKISLRGEYVFSQTVMSGILS